MTTRVLSQMCLFGSWGVCKSSLLAVVVWSWAGYLPASRLGHLARVSVRQRGYSISSTTR
jgi:hypothetical protein